MGEENIVKEVCKELGITQKELAERIGVDDGTVRKWSSSGKVPLWAKKFMNILLEYKNIKDKADKAKKIALLLDELKE